MTVARLSFPRKRESSLFVLDAEEKGCQRKSGCQEPFRVLDPFLLVRGIIRISLKSIGYQWKSHRLYGRK